MTGKEAAKRGWEGLSARSAWIFLGAGAAGLIASRISPDVLAWLKDPATVAAIIGFAQHAIKRTGNEVTNQFFERLGEHSAKIKQGEVEHGECMDEHAKHRAELAKHRAAISGLGWKWEGQSQ